MARAAELQIVDFRGKRVVPVTSDDEIAVGKAFNLAGISLPANVSLDDEELHWLSCPCHLVIFNATRAKGADRYAAELMGQPVLGYITLANSDLTDAGLERLATLPSLVDLDVSKTKVTSEAVKKFRAALPACRIVSPHGTIEAESPSERK